MLQRLNDFFPIRYTVFGLCLMGLALCIFTLVGFGQGAWWLPVFVVLTGLGTYDLAQSKRSILRNKVQAQARANLKKFLAGKR